MQAFQCPAKYRRYVESVIAVTLAEIGRDVDCREDEDVRVQRYAPVPDQFIDLTTEGTLTILVGDSNDQHATTDLPVVAGAIL